MSLFLDVFELLPIKLSSLVSRTSPTRQLFGQLGQNPSRREGQTRVLGYKFIRMGMFMRVNFIKGSVLDMRHLVVIGVDLSGNPIIGEWYSFSERLFIMVDWCCYSRLLKQYYFDYSLQLWQVTFLPALKFAQEQGLSVTLHCGEVPNMEEIRRMLEFLRERIGHACFLGEEEWKKLKYSKIPVEICLTSNVRTNTISSLDVHHFEDLYKSKHPIVLCTDDAGVFSTSLSKEYSLASSTFDCRYILQVV